jgi:hypothetical protein
MRISKLVHVKMVEVVGFQQAMVVLMELLLEVVVVVM